MGMGDIELTVKKPQAWALVNIDDDGTPLTLHGERMVEVSPGKWEDPLIAMALEYIAQDARTVPADG